MKVSIQLLTWNGEKYLAPLFESLKKQTFADWQLLVLDNGSSDRSVELTREQTKSLTQDVRLFQEQKNIGFAGGHNFLFEKGVGEYVLLLNQDIVLEPDCLAKLVAHLDKHPKTASVAPRLMRMGADDVIDSLGLAIFPSQRVIDAFQGRLYAEVLRDPKIGIGEQKSFPCFGVSSACGMYRRRAVQETGYLFDELYFSYKEDVDLAYRLTPRYGSDVILDAIAYHARSAAGSRNLSDLAAARNKDTQSDLVKYHSYKNHLMNIYKHRITLYLPFIFWYELKKFVYYLLFDPKVLKGWQEIWKHRKELRARRKSVQQRMNV